MDSINCQREVIRVEVEKLYDDVVLPEYKHDDDSGMDVKAYFSDEWVHKTWGIGSLSKGDAGFENLRFCSISCGERKIIPTGLKVAIPNGYEIQVRPRSGLAIKTGLTVLNTPGTIDAGYRGEIGVIIINTNNYSEGMLNYTETIQHGDRIAQLVLQIVPKVEWEVVDSVDETVRGEGGFGSTGNR